MKRIWILLGALLCGPAMHSQTSIGMPNRVISPCGLPGATADVQLTAALTLIRHGGVVDARCYGNSYQTIAASVMVGYPTNQDVSQTIVFDPSTYFVPASASMTMFNLIGSGEIYGLDALLPSSMTFTGIVVLVNKQPRYIHAVAQNIKCDASNETHSDYKSGSCIELLGSKGNPITFMGVTHVRCLGLQSCVSLVSSSGGYVNGNNISDVIALSSGAVLLFNNLDSIAYTQVAGNTFSQIIGEANAPYGQAGLTFLGTNQTFNNTITGLKLWDATTPITNTARAHGNFIIAQVLSLGAPTETGPTCS